MTGLEWLGVTSLPAAGLGMTGLAVKILAVKSLAATGLAFLAPLPPERPERRAPEPLRGNEWAAVLVIGSIFLMTVVPMVTIWSFHRPHDAVRSRCTASGGRPAPAALDGSGPWRCDHDGAAKAP